MESLKKVEKASLNNLTPELKASMDELREAAESMKRSYSAHDPEKASDEANTILNPVVKGSEAQRRRHAGDGRTSGQRSGSCARSRCRRAICFTG